MCICVEQWRQRVYYKGFTWTVLFIAVLHLCRGSVTGLTTILLRKFVSWPELNSSTAVVAAVAPVRPLQPHTVHWTVPEEAMPHLYTLTLAVFAPVLREGVSTGSVSGLRSIITGNTTFTPFIPFSPASINCIARMHGISLKSHDILIEEGVFSGDTW